MNILVSVWVPCHNEKTSLRKVEGYSSDFSPTNKCVPNYQGNQKNSCSPGESWIAYGRILHTCAGWQGDKEEHDEPLTWNQMTAWRTKLPGETDDRKCHPHSSPHDHDSRMVESCATDIDLTPNDFHKSEGLRYMSSCLTEQKLRF